jgi:Domain of unknown function (DUF4185)
MAHFFHGLRRKFECSAPLCWGSALFLPGILLLWLAGFAGSGCGHVSEAAQGAAVVSTTDLGAIPTDPDILGRDGGYSALFQGVSVWVYGDTFLAKPNAEGFTLISDSWSYTNDLTVQKGITGFQQFVDAANAPLMLLPETAVEQAFNEAHNGSNCKQQPCGARYALWPASVVVDPATGQALVFYGLVYALPGAFNFQVLGSSVATWQSLLQQPVRPTSNTVVVGHPDLMFSASEPAFGSASLISEGMLYVYGCGIPSIGTDKGCRLARVAPANVLNPNTWSFFAGNGTWSDKIGDAVPAFIGNNILSVAWNNYLQLYVAVYSAPLSQEVLMRTAPSPEGPWSATTLAFNAMLPASGNVYDAHAHPEYDANGGETIYVTYTRSLPMPFTSEERLVAVRLARVAAKQP